MKHLVTAATLAFACLLSTAQVQAQQYDKLNLGNQTLGNRVCATCHGAYGVGNPIVGGPSIAGLEPWYLQRQLESFRASYRGVERDYIPGHEMRASVIELSDMEIASLVAEISNWPRPAADPASVSGDLDHGSELYASCAACHGAEGKGNESLGAPALAGRDDWYLERQLQLFRSGYRGSHPEDRYGQQMRASIGPLGSSQDVKDVVAYIATLD
jgi:cytochrome c553